MSRFLLPALLCLISAPLAAQTIGLPSKATLFVFQGGDTPNVNHHMSVAAQRFGIDFVVVGGTSGREVAPAGARRIEDYFCWDTPVVSPVAGRIVQITDTLPDNPLGEHDRVNLLGNHVVIQSGDRYFYLAHLRRGSVARKVEATVIAGDEVGRCGNSGNSDFPHIHLHATRSPRFGEGTGLNLVFGPIRVELSGKVFEGVEWPMLAGLFVRSH